MTLAQLKSLPDTSDPEALMEQARKICVKKYGATSRVYQLDYKKWRVVCTTPGY